MGNATLALHLDVTIMEAAFFMDSFYKTFPHVKKYTQNVIEECRKKGYVKTLMKRVRHLPDITIKNPDARSMFYILCYLLSYNILVRLGAKSQIFCAVNAVNYLIFKSLKISHGVERKRSMRIR